MCDDGQWHHVACTWNGTSIRIYIDGVLKDFHKDADFGELQNNTRTIRIGTDNRYTTDSNDRQFTAISMKFASGILKEVRDKFKKICAKGSLVMKSVLRVTTGLIIPRVKHLLIFQNMGIMGR